MRNMNGEEYYPEIHKCTKAAIISSIIGTILRLYNIEYA